MDCEQATQLLCARLDGELPPDDRDELESHFEICPACRATADAFTLQDEELRRSFEPRRLAASTIAEQVAAEMPPKTAVPRREKGPRWGWTIPAAMTALAASLAVVVFLRVSKKPSDGIQLVINAKAIGAMTPKPRPKAPEPKSLAVGGKLETKAGERRRVSLPDGSVLYVNQSTTVTYPRWRRVELERGEVFVEVAPGTKPGRESVFLVNTPTREVTATGTKFSVRAAEKGTDVVVTQGKVEVADLTLTAGQRLSADDGKVSPSPRASHELDWTRDLMAAAESPLVPASKYAGGALVAVDPYGEQAKLSLRKYHVDVHIEDGFARTTIDQTFFNAENFRLEGTFYFPLPPDAQLSRLAMYVDGDLMEGGMADRDHARQTYERIRYTQRDPALLEWVDGSVFKMRVFPLEPRQEKRLVLGYTQKLPSLYNQATYRFPGGHTMGVVGDWSFAARVKNGARTLAGSPTHPDMTVRVDGDDLVLADKAQAIKPDADVVVELTDVGGTTAAESVKWSGAAHDSGQYLMLRYRPELPSEQVRERRDWVFVFEASGARDPLLARVQADVIKSVLQNAEHDDSFALLTAGTRVRSLSPERMPVTSSNVERATAFLDSTHLIGAMNVQLALLEAAPFIKGAANPHLVFVGSGVASLGEQKPENLAKLIPSPAKFVGVAVGKRWSRPFLKGAAEATGGYFTQINPDESVAWRGFELASTLNTPRLLNVTVSATTPDREEAPTFLTFANSLSQGEELTAVTRLERDEPMPASLTVKGLLNNQPFERTIPIADIAANAGYLPRAWTKLELDRMLAIPGHDKKKIVDLSKSMYVMTPYTSLLVLENEAMYREFKVDRGRKDHWAMYQCPDKIPVVYEPDPNMPLSIEDSKKLGGTVKPHENVVVQSLVVRQGYPTLTWPGQSHDNNAFRTAGHFSEMNLGDSDEDRRDKRNFFGRAGTVKARLVKAGGGMARHGLGLNWGGEVANSSRLKSSEALFEDGFTQFRFDSLSVANDFSGDMDLAERVENEELSIESVSDPEFDGKKLVVNSPVPMPEAAGVVDRMLSDTTVWDTRTGRGTEGFGEGRFRGLNRGESATPLSLLLMSDGSTPVDNSFAPPLAFSADGLRLSTAGFDPTVRVWHFHTNGAMSYGLNLDAGLNWRESVRDFETGKPLSGTSARRLSEQASAAPRPYGRPSFSGSDRLFTDLISYAPGMNSSPADVRAVLDLEAAPRFGRKLGKVDDAARKLVEASRLGDWVTTTLGGVAVTHDGTGRYAWERRTPLGLAEKVVCDGSTILHLYPELGIGARRPVSRHHRADWCAAVPSVLPPAEDFAHGADVVARDGRTVAVVPHRPAEAEGAYVEMRLVFAADGRFAERQWVVMPKLQVVGREVYAADGTVTVFGAEDKALTAGVSGRLVEAATLKWDSKPAVAPNLKPDTSTLVILTMPLRSRAVVYDRLGMNPNDSLWGDQNRCFEYLDAENALTLLTAEWAEQRPGDVETVWRECFFERGDRRVGFLVLTLAAGGSLSNDWGRCEQVLDATPLQKLAGYLSFLNRPTYSWIVQRFGPPVIDAAGERDFITDLTDFRAMHLRFNGPTFHDRYRGWRDEEIDRALAFAKRHKDDAWGWAAVTTVQDRVGGNDRVAKKLAGAWAELGDRYEAKYEEARSLHRAGDTKAARKKFTELFLGTLTTGRLPPIDDHFRVALRSDDAIDEWQKLMRSTASKVKGAARPVIVSLAWQSHQLGDLPLADALLTEALAGLTDRTEKARTTLAAVEYLRQTNQLAAADTLLWGMLADEEFAKSARLWRLGVELADQRGQKLRSIECLEHALDIEYQHLPPTIDVERLRADYRRLLDHYEWLGSAAAALKLDVPSDLATRTVRAADRWRALDPEIQDVCDRAAKILRPLGVSARDLAWDYMTTPLAQKPNEPWPWMSLGQTLQRSGDLELADEAFRAAFQAEPTNADFLWERAQNLKQRGLLTEREKVLRQVADTDWQPRFQPLKSQARQLLEGR